MVTIIAEIWNATQESGSDSDVESDGEEEVLVSRKQTMDALKTLEQRGGSDEDYDAIYHNTEPFFFELLPKKRETNKN